MAKHRGSGVNDDRGTAGLLGGVEGPAPGIEPTWRVRPGERVDLSLIDPAAHEGFADEAETEPLFKAYRKRIRKLQERLYAEHGQSLLVVLQATDTGGKDGTIRDVFKGVNPQGCQVWPFKVPTPEELDHDFLWRYHRKTPGRGMMTVFNRSHYEDVLIVRVKSLVPEATWRARYDAINAFERSLADNRTTVVKIFLHISREEQQRRLRRRLARADKHWKFDPADLGERERWDDYRSAFEDALSRCATDAAPWYVVPADHKWYRNLVVARTIARTLEAMDPRYPEPAPGLTDLLVPD